MDNEKKDVSTTTESLVADNNLGSTRGISSDIFVESSVSTMNADDFDGEINSSVIKVIRYRFYKNG